jgi:hypothetical protein
VPGPKDGKGQTIARGAHAAASAMNRLS